MPDMPCLPDFMFGRFIDSKTAKYTPTRSAKIATFRRSFKKKMPNKLKLVKGTLQPCTETTIKPKPSRDKGAYIKMRKGVMNQTAQQQ